jgi:hypothetical protein
MVFYCSLLKMSLKWEHPFTALVAGPTSCGKSVFVTRFLENLNQMVDVEVEEILWCYGVSQPLHNQIKLKVNASLRFLEGVPNMQEIAPEKNPPPRLLIIDDLMREADGNVVDIFSKGSHHRNLSVIFITQNIFHQGKGSRDMSLNAHYVVFFKNPREKSQIFSFARQVYPENPKFVHEAYADATYEPHSYLLFDMKQSTPEAYRLRSLIFPNEKNFVYIPKNCNNEYSKFLV